MGGATVHISSEAAISYLQSLVERDKTTLNASIDMMRRITEELRPTLLDNVGLLAALRWQIKDMCRRLAIQCDEHMPEAEPQLTPLYP
jgi:signal transduction histidine kinase